MNEIVKKTIRDLTTSSTTPPIHTLTGYDAASMLNASQAISSEIVLDRLVEKSLEVVVQLAGARRGFLIMNEQGQLTISAKYDIGADKKLLLLSLPVEGSEDLASSVVHHVERTRENVVLGDAAHEGMFSQAPDVQSNELKSVLCMPIAAKGELFAILYLENNLTTAAFTPERLQTLNLISPQIGISIANARLYRDIEKKMDERTRELEEKSELLTIAGEVLEQANQEMAHEIEQRKLLEEELRKLATTDYLTGLFIRRQLFELGAKEIARAKRHEIPLSLMILDIDHFKSINDTYGHATGDEVLKSFAAMFRDSLRNLDIVCRFGGEEFVAVLPDTDIQLALEVAQRLRQNIEESAMTTEAGELKYTISIGLTELRERDSEINQLIQRADEALYTAKKSGRNQVVIAPKAGGLPIIQDETTCD